MLTLLKHPPPLHLAPADEAAGCVRGWRAHCPCAGTCDTGRHVRVHQQTRPPLRGTGARICHADCSGSGILPPQTRCPQVSMAGGLFFFLKETFAQHTILSFPLNSGRSQQSFHLCKRFFHVMHSFLLSPSQIVQDNSFSLFVTEIHVLFVWEQRSEVRKHSPWRQPADQTVR